MLDFVLVSERGNLETMREALIGKSYTDYSCIYRIVEHTENVFSIYFTRSFTLVDHVQCSLTNVDSLEDAKEYCNKHYSLFTQINELENNLLALHSEAIEKLNLDSALNFESLNVAEDNKYFILTNDDIKAIKEALAELNNYRYAEIEKTNEANSVDEKDKDVIDWANPPEIELPELHSYWSLNFSDEDKEQLKYHLANTTYDENKVLAFVDSQKENHVAIINGFPMTDKVVPVITGKYLQDKFSKKNTKVTQFLVDFIIDFYTKYGAEYQ